MILTSLYILYLPDKLEASMSLSSIFSRSLIVLLMPFALRSEITFFFVSTIVSEVGVEVSESNLLLSKLVSKPFTEIVVGCHNQMPQDYSLVGNVE